MVDDGNKFVTYTVTAAMIAKKGQNAKGTGASPFQLSDDCTIYQNTQGIYRFASATSYTADTLKPADLLTVYTLAPDFSYGISSDKICKYSNGECIQEIGRDKEYLLKNRRIFKNNNYLIIYSWNENYFEVKFNYIADPLQLIGTTSINYDNTFEPIFLVSPNLRNIFYKWKVVG